MQDYIPEKQYERNMQHNYFILEEAEGHQTEDYVKKMLLENRINGLLPISNRIQDGRELYYYEINSMQPIERIFERKNMSCQDITILLKSYMEIIQKLEEYLLDYESLVLEPDCIYFHPGSTKVEFVYYPFYAKNNSVAFRELTEYILMKTEHTDEKAVKMAYQLYKIAREDNMTVDDIRMLLEDQITEESKEVQYSQNMSQEIKREEIPFAPVSYEEDSFHDESLTKISATEEEPIEVKKNKHKNISTVCMIIALICLGAFAAEKVWNLYCLESQYEMILFASIIAFAVAGIVFRIIGDKQEKQESVVHEMKENQKKMIYDEFHIEEDMIKNPYFERAKEESEFSKRNIFEEAGETTVIGSNEITAGNILKRIDGQGVEQYSINHFPFLIGRMSQCVDLVLEDSSISKMHARIEQKEGRLFLQDMNSTNGTMKNGMMLKLNESIPIDIGDEITFGRMTFRYQ